MSESIKRYFPGLNGIRFFATLLVILHHIEFVKNKQGLPNFMDIVFFQKGHCGVILFFVLSGFLITYLLLEEQKTKGNISFKNFYLRRILRIWPLYYLIIFVAFFVLNIFQGNKVLSSGEFYLFVIILPNLSLVLYPMVEGIYHLWTIGVEEQFYLFAPLNIRYFKKHLLKVLISIALFFPVVRLLLLHFYKYYLNNSLYTKFTQFFLTLEFECIAIGGVGAFLVFNNKTFLLKIIYNVYVQILTYITMMYLLFFDLPDLYFNNIFISMIFMIFIVNVATNPHTLVKFENTFLNYMGRISYGLYVFHLGVILIVLKIIKGLNSDIDSFGNFMLYSSTIIITIAVSGLSYYIFEKKFLTLKERFAF